MSLSTWSIRNPIPAVLLFVLLTLLGLMAFKQMRIQQFMDIELPTITITASLPGAAPAQMETEVARKIENSVANLQGVKHLYTKAQEGLVTVTVEFRLEKTTQEALDEVRDAVSRIRADLPTDMRDPAITKVNLSGAPILTYSVSAEHLDDEALSWFVDNTITKSLLAAKGVGAVTRVGGVNREIQIELDPTRLRALGLTATEISRQLRMTQQDASAGRMDLAGQEQSVRALGNQPDARALQDLELPLRDGRPLRLRDVAQIRDTLAEPRQLAFLNGQPVVGFEITRSRGASEVAVAEAVRSRLGEIQRAHPHIRVVESFNFVDPVIENFEGSMSLLIEGALLAVLVVWLFLRDGRATLVAATALPLSAIPTFAVMAWMDFSLNVVTLLSLSLVVGVLVDDAIVEIENIMRHLADGKTPFQAALEAADEIGLAVIATTFTLIAVFLPTAFMSGVAGKFFVQFGWTAAIAVFFSLVVARLLTPMMAAYLLRPPKQPLSPPRWLAHYQRWAEACLRHRGITLTITTLFFLGSFALVPLLPKGFLPPDDLSQTQIHLALPPGSPLAQTATLAEEARRLAVQNPHVRGVYTTIGGGAAGSDPFMPGSSGEVRKATLTLSLTPRDERPRISKQSIEQSLRDALKVLPGVQVRVGLGAANDKYILVLASEEGDKLAAHARQVEQELRRLQGIGAVTSSASLTRPELILQPDVARMADLGVTTSSLAETVRVATRGDYDQNLAKLTLSQRQVPIVVKLPPQARVDLDTLRQLTVPGAHGPVLLSNVATLTFGSGPAVIDRYDRLRNINFEIELGSRPLGEVEAEAKALPSLAHLPPGILQTTVGDAEAMGELFDSFGLAMATGVLCIYIVLVLLFRDFVQPVTILAALILSIPGAFLALFLTGTALSMPSMIGLIMLMGIATKNSILLIDYVILARRDHGLSRWEAILDACRKRARPIIMTTLAMGAGMMPIALGLGTDPSFRAPMAIVVIGGLITSTFLSLLVIPVVFSFVDDLRVRVRTGRFPEH